MNCRCILALCLAACWLPAYADITIGAILSLTGPAASLGIPEKNALTLIPRQVGGEKIHLIVLDDASDPTNAVQGAKKLIGEHNADLIIGPSTTGASLAMIDSIFEGRTPNISLGASSRIIAPMDEKRRWIFKPIPNESQPAELTVSHMRAQGIGKVGFIGFADAYGDTWAESLKKAASAGGIEIVGIERYVRTDTSVTSQILKIMTQKPDAVFIAASGTPAALPQIALVERGYKGAVYQTYGIANNDFLRVSGKDADGALFAVAPVIVADQLPESNPSRKVALDLIRRYEAAFGAGSLSIFASNAWDAWGLVERAIPAAIKAAKPGSAEFRKALRDAIENTKDHVSSQGVFNMTATDHVGYDMRASVMVRIAGGKWQLVR